MIHICICEDDLNISNYYSDLIKSIVQTMNVNISVFSSGESLLFHFADKSNQIDIIFADIEMGGINGIQTMIKMRENGYCGELIYLTSIKDYVFDTFETKPLNYLIKQENNTQKLIKTLISAIESTERKNNKKSINIGLSTKKTKIYTDEIQFIESYKRKIVVHINNGDFYEGYIKLVDIVNEINDEYFMRVHKSFAVNFKFVKSIDKNVLTMFNGTQINIGRVYLSDVKNRFSSILIKDYELIN